MIAGDTGKLLLSRVRASTAPHDDALAAELKRVHDQLRENETRVLLTVGQFAAPLVLLPAFYLSLPVFVGLIGATVIGAGKVALRSRRRSEEVRMFARSAQVGTARALQNGTKAPGIAAYETERRGRAYLRVEVRDGDRTFTARLVRDRPRGFSSVDLEQITLLYAQHSNVVVGFDARGEMILGTVEDSPLPTARLLS